MDDELYGDFRLEALEGLQEIEEQLLALENGDPLAVDVAFRAIHSIKGNSSFFDLVAINSLAHQLEYLLDQVRSGLRPPTPELCDLLLQGGDHLRRYLAEPALGVTGDEPGRVLKLKVEAMAAEVGDQQQTGTAPILREVQTPTESGPAEVLAGIEASPHLGTWLLQRQLLSEEQLLQALVAQAETEPSEMDILVMQPELPPAQCIAIADHAVVNGNGLFTACANLGLLSRRRLQELRAYVRNQRRPLAKAIVGLGMADAETVADWLRRFMDHRGSSAAVATVPPAEREGES